jgi:IPT/TIG domain
VAIRLGTHEDSVTVFNAALAGLGHGPVTDLRCFGTPGELPSGGHWARTLQLSQLGYIVHMSFKQPGSMTMAQVASGSYDTQAATIGNFLATCPTPGYITFFHEFMSGANEPQAASFVTAFNRLMVIIKARAPGWKVCNVYVGGVFWFLNGGGPEKWWTTEATVLGCDTYDRRNAPYQPGVPYADPASPWIGANLLTTPHSGRTPPLTFARSKGVTLVVPELGVAVTPPSFDANYAITQRKWWLDGFAADIKNITDIEYVNYYERDTTQTLGGNTVNWALTGGALPAEPQSVQSFWLLSQPSVAPPPTPTISSFSPTTGLPAITVTIFGTNFTGTTAVRFGGVLSTFGVISSTRIDAVVPAAAVSGVITVTNAAGTATSSTPFVVGTNPDPTFSGAGVVPPMTRVRQAG